MKKNIIVIFIILGINFFIFSTNLSKLYRNGKADFKVDKSFGLDTEWDMIFPTGVRSIVFKKDGSFFATSMGGKNHKVFYFNKKGKLIKKIGQKGEGPGDFYLPSDLSILDNKYLIIGEYATKRRVSVFDLNGKFVKILRVKSRNCFGATAILNGKIAYFSYGRQKTKGEYDVTEIKVFIKSLNSGKEKKVEVLFEKKSKKLKGQGSVSINYFDPDIYLKVINSNKILCAFSENSNVFICSLDGKVLKTFKIDYKVREIPEETKETVYNYFLKRFKKSRRFGYSAIKRMWRNKTLFNDNYPLYSEIVIDSNNNIMFFRANDGAKINSNNELYVGNSTLRFLKYSPKGKLIGKHEIDFSDNESKFFTPKYIFNNAAYVYSDENGLQRILLDQKTDYN